MKSQINKLKNNLLGDVSQKPMLEIPYFILTISLIVTCFITYFFYSNAKNIDAQRFNNEVIKVRNEITNKLETYIALLRASRSHFKTSNNINKKSFEDFVGQLRLREFYPGMQGIGYSKIFSENEKAELQKRMIAEGYENFTFTPNTIGNQNQAIIYLAPLDERNAKAIGFDMSSEPIRNESIKTARDLGTYAISGKVILKQDTETPGFLIYLPVYKSDKVPNSVEEKREKIEGYIYSPFRANEFVKDIVKSLPNDHVSFKIYDQSIDENNFLASGFETNEVSDSSLKLESKIEINNRTWIVTYLPTNSFSSQSLTWWTIVIFLLGSAISTILFFLSFSQAKTNEKLSKTASELLESQEEVKKLLISETVAREKAEIADKVKAAFISTVSHELRTPLNAIAGWLPILKPETLTPEIKNKALTTIEKNLRKQVSLVEDMIVFSDGNYLDNLNYEEIFSVNDLVEECLETIKTQLNEKSLVLTRNLNSTNDKVKGNRQKMKKTLLRLFDNSIKFTPNSGQISVESSSDETYYKLLINDNGEGIEKDKLPLLFGNFGQTDSSTTRKHEGLGLGLAIAKKVIEHHQGELCVDSEGLGKGTSILIYLPLLK